MSLPYPTDPSLPANPSPLFSDVTAARGDQMRANNSEIWANFDALMSYIASLQAVIEPVGSIRPWHKTLTGTPALPAAFKECDGSAVSDVDSLYNGYRVPNLNGANVVLTLTWTANGGGSYTTVNATDITALAIGDSVAGTGIAASTYIIALDASTRKVTISDINATGSISSTFSNAGRFLRGGATSGTGQWDTMQQITGSIDAYAFTRTSSACDSLGAFNTAQTGSYAGSDGAAGTARKIAFDSANSPNARTGTETRPVNTSMVYIMRIK